MNGFREPEEEVSEQPEFVEPGWAGVYTFTAGD